MITYFLQTSLCWLFFLVIYTLFLKKETFFLNNRWYLLITLCIGLLFPFIREVWESVSSTPVTYIMPLQGSAQVFELNDAATNTDINYMQIISILFWLGFIISFIKLLKEIYSILLQLKKYPHKKYTTHTEIKTDYAHLPFSFFNYVFISDRLQFKDPEWNRILTHEVSHVRGWHSLDILFLELVGTFFWWNPLIYLYKKNIRDTHEYIADDQVLKSTDTGSYGSLLIGAAQSGLQMSLANHFIYSQLKNRINMMLKNKSNKSLVWKYTLVLPSIIFLAILFAYKTPETSPTNQMQAPPPAVHDTLPSNLLYVLNGEKVKREEINNLNPEQITNMNVLKDKKALEKYGQDGINGVIEILTKTKYLLDGAEVTKEVIDNLNQKDIYSTDIVKYGNEPGIINVKRKSAQAAPREIFKVVEESPRFPGCESLSSMDEKKKCAAEKMLQYLYQNIRYPDQARKDSIQGRAVITFVIEKDGRITDAEIVRDLGGGCGAEALRVINLMNSMPEKWIPGKQGGKSVAVQFNIPIAFKLSGNSSSNLSPSANSFDKNGPSVATSQLILKSKTGQEIFKVVEEAPRFPGCENLVDIDAKKKCADEKMLQFLYQNIKYPLEAKEKGIQGRVVIGFVIEADGTVGESAIVKEIGGGCGAEALRVINLMNTLHEKWIPGKQRGNAVAVQYNIPMAFKLENGSMPAPKESTEKEITKVLVTAAPPDNQKRDVVKSMENKLSLIPNPANKKVDILYHQAKNVKIEIIDLSGRLMHQSNWDSFGGRQSIDISKLANGTYVVRVKEGNKLSEQKLVVQ